MPPDIDYFSLPVHAFTSGHHSQTLPSQHTFNTPDEPSTSTTHQPSAGQHQPAQYDVYSAHNSSPNRTDPVPPHPTTSPYSNANGYNVNMTSPGVIPTTEMGSEQQNTRPSRSPLQAPPQVPQPPPEHQHPQPTTAAGAAGVGGGSIGDQPQFDIFEWYPKYQSCQRYFANHAQYSAQVQAVTAFVNISLPSSRFPALAPGATTNGTGGPSSSSPRSNLFNLPSTPNTHRPTSPSSLPHTSISLLPYLRRLVITGLDFPGVLHGFFGDDWTTGIGPLHEQERRNYLFAAKSGGWGAVKKEYDLGAGYGVSGAAGETVPFMRPLQAASGSELEAAERSWSEWLAMEDWMLGNRCPEGLRGVGAGRAGVDRQEEGGGQHGNGGGMMGLGGSGSNGL